VLVLEQERLHVELKRELPDCIKVLLLPKSGGVVCKSQDTRTQTKNLRIHEYFYGTTSRNLYPHSIEIGFKEVKIFEIGAPQLPDSLLPMGMKPEDNYTKIFQKAPCKFCVLNSLVACFFKSKKSFFYLASALKNHLLSVSNADDADDESDRTHLMETNIAGFLVV